MTKKPKRVMTKAPRAACTYAGALGRFLADVTCAWELYGKETLERMAIEQPLMFFETMIDLIAVAHQEFGEPIDFGPRKRQEARRRPQPQLDALFRKLNGDFLADFCRTWELYGKADTRASKD